MPISAKIRMPLDIAMTVATLVLMGGNYFFESTAVRGYDQEWGKPAVELNPGDVVNIPAGVKQALSGQALSGYFVRPSSASKQTLYTHNV